MITFFFMRLYCTGVASFFFFERNRKKSEKRTIRSNGWFDAGAPCTELTVDIASDTENQFRVNYAMKSCTAVLYHLPLFVHNSRPRLKFVSAYGTLSRVLFCVRMLL